MKQLDKHIILTCNRRLEMDHLLKNCILKVMDWSNRMGLEGKKCLMFEIQQPSDAEPPFDPFANITQFVCYIESEKETNDQS